MTRGQADVTESCPSFEGRRLYYRGLNYLYCVEEGIED
jgi:hypothetical protein